MSDVLTGLAPNVRRRLIGALEVGLLEVPCDEQALRVAVGSQDGLDDIAGALTELSCQGLDAPSCAALLRALESVEARQTKPDFVWSGPEVAGLHARDTRRVYDEILGAAERSVWASTYAFFDGPRAFEKLAKRMDAVQGLEVTLCLNIQRKRGDTSAEDDVVRRFADRFWSHDWPGKARPRVFFDPRSLAPDGPDGVLHAKAVVADAQTVFVTSANFTEAALDRNIEIGLLVRDAALAQTMICHFQGLIDQKLLSPLPAS
jgi:phosphatidylserine/phosphatidylglycerophosphate/cardiolipin synthase-like enzyme